jgi:hypothetical protein
MVINLPCYTYIVPICDTYLSRQSIETHPNSIGDLSVMVEILRKATMLMCRFTDQFKGFDKVRVVKRIFGAETQSVLAKLKVEFTSATRYMRVDDTDGHLVINPNYLRTGDITEIYLDIVHELVHVRQSMEGKNSDKQQIYVERPLEIEAYQIAVAEARTLGLDDHKILDYLDSDLVNQEELKQLAQVLDVQYEIL